MTSPARAMMSRPGQKSILKRPASLALQSPTAALPFHASFSVMSPGKTPHVHFLNTPQLVATFVTHSSETYDRAPIKVSPNPLALPARGARYYSPTVENFKLAAPPPPKAAALQRLNSILKATQCASPAITDFPDPRSPQAAAAAAPSFQQIRFASFAAAPRHQPRDLASSIASYPRSPYPSAPLSPAETMGSKQESRGRRLSDPSVKVTRARSHDVPSRPSRAPVPPSPLQSSFKAQGLQRPHKPTPLALDSAGSTSSLSNAFWDSMTLEGETPMVTALEYPESAVQMEDIDLQSPSFVKSPKVSTPAPALMFGGQDGSVWSPSAVPKKTAARDMLLRSALMSPAKAAFAKPKQVKRAVIASPSPNDPFASFPSFAAALTLDTSSIPLSRPSMALLEAA